MSKIKPFLSDLLMVAMTILFAALLTACGRSPAAPPNPEDELAACRAAMEELQSHDNIRISVFRDFSTSAVALNGSSTVDYWRSGEGWFEIAQADCDTIINATMCCDGQYFDNSQNYLDSRDYDIKWNRASPIPDITPWIYACRWDEQDVSHVSSGYAGSSRVITVRFNTPYIFYGAYVSEGYQAEFHLDAKGRLEKVVLDAVYTVEEAVRDKNGKTGDYREKKDRWVDTFTVVSTDEKKISSRIAKEYESALAQCGESPEAKEALEKCRAVLEELQSHDSYHVSIEVESADANYVKEILRNGDNWMFIQNNRGKSGETIGDIGFLSCGGQKFNTQSIGMKQSVEDLKWGAVEVLPERMEKFEPWLYSCNWEEQEVSLVHQSFGSSGWGAIFVMFKTPYVYPDGKYPVTENYVVQFSLDPERNLVEAIMRAFYHYEQPQEQENDFMLAEEFTVLSTDETEIAARIDREYQRALAQNNMTK